MNEKKLIEEVNQVLKIKNGAVIILVYAIRYNTVDITTQKVVDFYNNEIVPIMKKNAEEAQRVINATFNNNNITHELQKE